MFIERWHWKNRRLSRNYDAKKMGGSCWLLAVWNVELRIGSRLFRGDIVCQFEHFEI